MFIAFRATREDLIVAFYAYLLRCRDGSFYVGHTDELQKRIEQHRMSLGGSYTRTRLPVTLEWFQEFKGRDEAKAAEARIKGWNRAKKEALIRGDFGEIAKLASRSGNGRALRDALLRPSHGSGRSKAPQERG